MKKSIYLALVLMLVPFLTNAATPGSLTGSWRLTSITMDGQTINCPGAFILPPGTPDIVKQFAKCGNDETLELKAKGGQGFFHSGLTLLNAALSPDGYWFSDRVDKVGNYIVFVDGALLDGPRAYVYTQSKDKKKLSVSLNMRVNDPVAGKLRSSLNTMVFEKR